MFMDICGFTNMCKASGFMFLTPEDMETRCNSQLLAHKTASLLLYRMRQWESAKQQHDFMHLQSNCNNGLRCDS